MREQAGAAEAREWVDVRVTWHDIPENIYPGGTEVFRLDNDPAGGGTHTYFNNFPGGASRPELGIIVRVDTGGTFINGNLVGSAAGWEIDNWTKLGAGLGTYTGPLTDNSGPGQVNTYTSFIIVGLGPTIAGPGDDGIDDPDGDGEPGGDPPPGGDPGDDPEPGPDGEPGEATEPPELPLTGIECIDDLLEDLKEIPIIDAFMALTVGIGSEDASITFPLPIPGEGTSQIVLSSDPAELPIASSQMAGIRSGLRIMFSVWFSWIGVNAMFQALIRW